MARGGNYFSVFVDNHLDFDFAAMCASDARFQDRSVTVS
mgnify:CR=1 FL=1